MRMCSVVVKASHFCVKLLLVDVEVAEADDEVIDAVVEAVERLSVVVAVPEADELSVAEVAAEAVEERDESTEPLPVTANSKGVSPTRTKESEGRTVESGRSVARDRRSVVSGRHADLAVFVDVCGRSKIRSSSSLSRDKVARTAVRVGHGRRVSLEDVEV